MQLIQIDQCKQNRHYNEELHFLSRSCTLSEALPRALSRCRIKTYVDSQLTRVLIRTDPRTLVCVFKIMRIMYSFSKDSSKQQLKTDWCQCVYYQIWIRVNGAWNPGAFWDGPGWNPGAWWDGPGWFPGDTGWNGPGLSPIGKGSKYDWAMY